MYARKQISRHLRQNTTQSEGIPSTPTKCGLAKLSARKRGSHTRSIRKPLALVATSAGLKCAKISDYFVEYLPYVTFGRLQQVTE